MYCFKPLCLSIAIGIAAMSAGCALKKADDTVIEPVQLLAIKYSGPTLAVELQNSGLQNQFLDYWEAHVKRDWKRKYEIEDFPRPVAERFYIAYFAKAWPLRLIEVTSIAVTSSDASVDVVLTLEDPESAKIIVQEQRDQWKLIDGVWRHVVRDPMLTGIFH